MKKILTLLTLSMLSLGASAQTAIAGALASYNEQSRGKQRTMQYKPEGRAFVCVNGTNRFTRALYGGPTDYRIETSDRPIFAVVKKGQHRSVRFVVNGVPLDSTDYCKAFYQDGMREYWLADRRWDAYGKGVLKLRVAALHDEEGAIWQFVANDTPRPLSVSARVCQIANTKLKRNGDLGADAPGLFEPAPGEKGLVVTQAMTVGKDAYAHVVIKLDEVVGMPDGDAYELWQRTVEHNRRMASRVTFNTPDPYINTLGSALVMAADGDWDGQTWLHGCIGWRMPLAGWRAAYVGDVLGWGERAVSHFDAYAKSQVTDVPPTRQHPTQDAKMNMARAEKSWGTQMYSNGYICRNPQRNDQMHHYDMNLNYIDELLWHFQFDADLDYMRKMWPVIKSHLAWEKRNFDPDGDHLYDAYCCIWASDALYYSGGAVTHSSAYNYRGNRLAARIAELIGEDASPYNAEADAILQALNTRLWMPEKGVWAEYQEAMGLRRLHDHPAVWSIYTPIDCGACSPEQAWKAAEYVDCYIPHIAVEESGFYTISTSDWLPYSWSINNVASAEVMHTALACFEAGRQRQAFELLKANILDNMYYGQSPANFGQLSHYDAARGECYRDFGDCIGIASRALVQGLFGVVPEALYGRLLLRPGFPTTWDHAELRTPYIEYKFTRTGGQDRYEITQRLPQLLKVVVRQNLGGGRYRDIEGTAEAHQVITCATPDASLLDESTPQAPHRLQTRLSSRGGVGTDTPVLSHSFTPYNLSGLFNAEVGDVFNNEYRSPRPQTTTLQIPLQGVGEWCHPQYKPTINDSVFRTLIKSGVFNVAGVPFLTPKSGRNIVFTSLWDNYPDSVELTFNGKKKYSAAYLLMAGTTNHMQCHIDNGLVVATYTDGHADTLRLRNPENWCPIELDYYVDGKAFCSVEPRPYRVCLGTGTVSRDLGKELNIKGVYGREIPGGAAQMLCLRLDPKRKLARIAVRTLSNDVVVGLMGLTLQ